MVTPVSSLPSTSSAVNIQIIEPKNFPGGAVPGQVGQGASPFGAQQPGTATPYVTPYGDPQQQLQQAYQNAMNARNQAEQARNQYLQTANQLNSQAYQQPQQNQFAQGFYPPTVMQQNNQPYNPYGPGTYPGYFPQIQYPQYAQYPQQQFPQQQLQQQPMDPMAQQQQQQVDPAAQQQPVDPMAQQQQQQPPQQPGLSGKSIDELNQMLANPQTLQEKVDAMEEIGVRGQATPETFGMLAQEALTDTSQLTGQAKDDANYVRQASLWTLGMLNKAQNSQVPTAQLPGLDAIRTILNNKKENDDVQAAAIQALQVIDRPNDKTIRGMLKGSAGWREKNPDVKRLAKDALSGKSIPLPAGGGAQGMDPMAAMGGASGAAGDADPMAGLAELLGGGGGVPQDAAGAQGGGFDPSQLMQALGGGGQQI